MGRSDCDLVDADERFVEQSHEVLREGFCFINLRVRLIGPKMKSLLSIPKTLIDSRHYFFDEPLLFHISLKHLLSK